MKKVLNIITTVVIVILLIIGVFVLISLIPIKGNYKILAVMSGSMKPTIPTGSLVIIKPCKNYNVNDIVTFKSYGSQKKNDFTTHRIVDLSSDSGETIFFTKGDANKSQDTGYLTHDQIKGKVFLCIALVGYIIGYAKTLPGLIIIIVLATIIVYEEIKKIRNEIKRIRRSKQKQEAKQTKNKKKIRQKNSKKKGGRK